MLSKLISKYRLLPVQLKASIWFLVCAFLQRGISAITTPIFTRLMSTTEYGTYSVFSSWMSIITCFVTLNLYGGVYSQGLIKFDDKRKEFSSAFQGLVLTLVLIWLIIYLVFHKIINSLVSLSTPIMMLMFVLIWTSAVFNLWAVEQRTDSKYKSLVVISLITSIMSPIIGIVLVIHSDDKVLARIFAWALVSIVVYCGLFIRQLRLGKVFYSKKIWRYALGLAIPLIPHYLSQMILNSSDRIMIGRMVGNDAAGIYSLAYNVSLIMSIFNSSLLSTIEPWIYQKIKAKELEQIQKVAYPSFGVVAFVNMLLIAFAPEVIKFFAPPEYYDAIWVIPPIAMSVFFMFTYSFFALFEFYFEKAQYITIATVTGAVINIILNYICIKIWGYEAAGYTTLICYIIYVVMHYYFMRKICDEKLNGARVYNVKIVIGIALVFMIFAFAFMITYNFTLIRYILIAVIIIVIILKRENVRNIVTLIIGTRKEGKQK